jgi:hypothetical protein
MRKSKKKYFFVPIVIIVVSFFTFLDVRIVMFNKQIEYEVKRLFSNSKYISDISYSVDKISSNIDLPEPVQRFFKYSLQNNTHYISFVKLKHEGTFRQSQGQDGCQ